LHGICTKLALDIACGSDIRICTSGTRFSLGNVTAPNTSLETALKGVPPALLLMDSVCLFSEFLMTGRAFEGKEAQRIGFISSVFETKDEAVYEAQKLAGTIAQRTVELGFKNLAGKHNSELSRNF
jgi:delta(3,5)-delta(2,4)-dienoyl-CoA isomerase